MPLAMRSVIERARAEVLLISYNDESWITAEAMIQTLHDSGHEDVRMLEFDYKRYVGAQIGVFNPSGEKVGKVSHLRNTEYVFVAGPTEKVEAAVAAASATTRCLHVRSPANSVCRIGSCRTFATPVSGIRSQNQPRQYVSHSSEWHPLTEPTTIGRFPLQ